MNVGAIAEAISTEIPHTQREHAEATRDVPRRFGAGVQLLPDDFATRLLGRERAYDPQLAYALAVVAGWSYADGKTLADKLRYYGLQAVTVERIAVTNPAMLIVASAFFIRSECGRVGILSFRGTEPANAINWLTDTDVMQRPFGDGVVHQGFYANLQAVWEEVSTKLYEAIEPAPRPTGDDPEHGRVPLERLYITGHSLGGAMAVLAAAKIAVDESPSLRHRLHGIYTFGQPAVGDIRFATQCKGLFGDRLYRHVYAHDVVPCLPPTWDGRFVHFGEERVALKDESWIRPQDETRPARWVVSAVASCAASFVARRLPLLERLDFPYSLDDHSPTRYIEASRTSLLGR